MKKSVIVVCIAAMGCMIGCARVSDSVKCVLGISTKVLEDNRSNAVVKEFPIEEKACYSKTEEALSVIGAYVYRKNAQMIAFYVSESDTTPVGIFFTPVSPALTKLEFSSPSTFAKEYIARRVSLRLEGKEDVILSEGEGKKLNMPDETPQPQTKRLQNELQN